MPGWSPHPRLAHCGAFEGVPEPFEALFTLRGRPRAASGPGPDLASLAREMGVPPRALWRAQQVHGDRILRADELPAGGRAEADGLVTCAPGVFLVGLSADCPLLLLADPRTGAAGMAHSGWRGTARAIGATLVARLAGDFGARPADLVAWIAPAIGPCCYEVGEEVFDALAPRVPDLERFRRGARHLDLVGANRAVLVAAGLDPFRIRDTGCCTACRRDLCFSYRAEGQGCGHLAALIGRRA